MFKMGAEIIQRDYGKIFGCFDIAVYTIART